MDPNALLERIRRLADRAMKQWNDLPEDVNALDHFERALVIASIANELAGDIEDLDAWLKARGALPKEWSR